MDQLLYLALFIACGVIVIKWFTARNGASGSKAVLWDTISPEAAKARMDAGGAVVLDVGTEEEFSQGHITGAVCLPVDAISPETAAACIPTPETEVLVYCRAGHRSAQAAKRLSELGYVAVSDFGSISDWPYAMEGE